jgi:hypothetical protein
MVGHVRSYRKRAPPLSRDLGHMRTDDLLEHCLQALRTGQDLPPDVARYLARHPERRAEVEDLLSVAQQASQLPPARLSAERRSRMQRNLAGKLGFDPVLLNKPTGDPEGADHEQQEGSSTQRKRFFPARLFARLRYEPPPPPKDPLAEPSIREVFSGLTPDDIRRYIGVRGIDYLRYRRDFPYWRPVFICIAAFLRGFKRIEQLAVNVPRD